MSRTDVGGVAAALTAALLLAGVVGALTGRRRWQPWLLVLVDVDSGRRGASHEALRSTPPVDLVLLVLAGVAYAGFWPGPGARHAWWMLLAVAQPLLGVVVLLATRLAGRSGLMGGALVLSTLLVLDDERTAGWLGVGAAVLLLVGDLATTGEPRRPLVPVLVAGYAALTAWFGWLAVLLLT